MVTCVRWESVASCMFQLTRGIRQGGVLSAYLFALHVNDIVSVVERTHLGCYCRSVCISIVIYADDILLLSPSVSAVQNLLHVTEDVLK